MQQIFSVEKEARVHLLKTRGDLEVRGWDKREISLDYDDHSGASHQEGNVLTLVNCASDVTLLVPFDVEVHVEGLEGEVQARDIRRIELKNVRGTVKLSNIGNNASLEYIGEAISLVDIGGDVEVQKAASLRTRRKIGGEARLQDIRWAEIEAVRSDLQLHQVDMASIGSVGGDLEVVNVREALRCGNVGGDCEVRDSTGAEFSLGNVGGHLQLGGASKVHVGNAGDDVELRNIQGSVHIGNAGGDGTLTRIGGNVTIGRIGGDAHLLDLDGSLRVGAVGGDLELRASFAPESKTHAHVGGEALVTFPQGANLALQATVGGTVSGSGLALDRNGNLVRLVYGEGMAQVNLSVGGDLQLRGGGTPRVSSASMPWGEFSQEMADLGQSMAQMGADLGKEFMDIFGDMGQATFSWTDDVGRKVADQIRHARQKAEEHARKAEERARRAEEHARRHSHERERRRAERFYVRVNEREWQMNPERLNDLVNRAHEAALDGVVGAMEAVERAVNNLRVQYPPRPPMPPTPPSGRTEPPVPPVPSAPPAPPEPLISPVASGEVSMPPIPPYPVTPAPASQLEPESATGSAQEVEAAEELEETGEPDREAEREAILRMIAEGRITPEEGDMLLEGLSE